MFRYGIAALVAIIAAVSPYFGIPGWTPALGTITALVSIILIGLNLTFGYCGMLALGQAAFAVMPAYLSGIMTARGVPVVAALPLGLLITVVIARGLAEIFIRLPGIYLAVGTLGFAYVVEGIARAFPAVTGGASGLVLTLPFVPTENQWYLFSVLSLTIATLLAALLLKGPAARKLKLVRRDELSASVNGINVVRVKANTFSLGASFSAAGGLLLAYYTSVVTPEMGGANASLEYLAMVVIGGAGSLAGPIIGAALIHWLFAVAGAAARYELLVYGACFLAVILFAPGGLAQLFARFGTIRKVSSKGSPSAAHPVKQHHSWAGQEGLRAVDLSKRFGGLTAVQNVSLDVARGEVVAILGPNGAGKSTFFNILSGIERADEGSVLLDGIHITNSSIHERAAVIGRSFQVPRLVVDMTVLQNVITRVDQLYPDVSDEGRREIALGELDRFDLADIANKTAGQVAVGHHKLIDIARAAVGTPPLLLLDEPAVGLTSSELEALKQIILTLKKSGSAVVVVDHNVDFVMTVANRILVMESGRPIALGLPQDVLSAPNVRAAYLGVLE